MLLLQNSRAVGSGPMRFLLYGGSGSGKTTAAATFPRPLFVDCEGGLLSVRDRGVDYVRCSSIAEVLEAVATVRAHGESFETVVVDSLTEVARMAMEGTMRRAEGANAAGGPSLAEWGRCIHTLRQIVRSFLSLPIHVVFTALPRQIKSPTGELQAVRPWLPGRLADEVAAAMDFVLFLHGQESADERGERVYSRGFLTVPHRKVFAKDRSGKLPMWVDPTWAALAGHLVVAAAATTPTAIAA
jgi:hypothetical protein